MARESLTQARLKELIHYDQYTGLFVRIGGRPNGKIKIGDVAGSTDDQGYVTIGVDGTKFAAGRLAFLWMTGSWPIYDCDHRDGNPSNNRWSNLRDATTTQNLRNKRIQSNNSVGLKGVTMHKPGQWRARIKTANKQLHLGCFDCPAAAHFVYVVAAERFFGSFARAN